MASSATECPTCWKSDKVRLLKASRTKLEYWCEKCRTPFVRTIIVKGKLK